MHLLCWWATTENSNEGTSQIIGMQASNFRGSFEMTVWQQIWRWHVPSLALTPVSRVDQVFRKQVSQQKHSAGQHASDTSQNQISTSENEMIWRRVRSKSNETISGSNVWNELAKGPRDHSPRSSCFLTKQNTVWSGKNVFGWCQFTASQVLIHNPIYSS